MADKQFVILFSSFVISCSLSPSSFVANFRTHITTSTVLGFGYAGAGLAAGAPLESALLAGGLCGVSGMLPDLDSGSGIPLRETMAFLAAVVPLLLVDRFVHMGFTYESMVLAGGSIYLFIRFGVARLLARYTVHRGMFHSIPAALTFAGLGFLICGCSNLSLRYYKAGAIFIGYMSHLILDEIYAIESKRGRMRFKKSFGTALKVWGDSMWGNFTTYAKLILVAAMIMGEPTFMENYGTENPLVGLHERIEEKREHYREGHGAGGRTEIDQTIYDTAKRLWERVWN